MHVVYFARAGTGLIKIGQSWKVRARIAGLRLQVPTELRLVTWVRGHRDDERAIHLALCDSKSHGEWFRPTPSVSWLMGEISRTRRRNGEVSWLDAFLAERLALIEPPHSLCSCRPCRDAREAGALAYRYQDIVRAERAAR